MTTTKSEENNENIKKMAIIKFYDNNGEIQKMIIDYSKGIEILDVEGKYEWKLNTDGKEGAYALDFVGSRPKTKR
jgi:hypothetical protein